MSERVEFVLVALRDGRHVRLSSVCQILVHERNCYAAFTYI
jgi:hypothetical protein